MVGETPQLIDRDHAGVLELAADLRLLDEPPHQLGLLLVGLEQDLDGQVAAQVDIVALQDGAHAAPGDLAEELEPCRAVGQVGHLRGRGLEHRRVGLAAGGVVAEQDVRHRADRGGQRVEHAGAGGDGRVGVQGLLHQAAGAEALGAGGGPRRAAARAAVRVGHRRIPLMWDGDRALSGPVRPRSSGSILHVSTGSAVGSYRGWPIFPRGSERDRHPTLPPVGAGRHNR